MKPTSAVIVLAMCLLTGCSLSGAGALFRIYVAGKTGCIDRQGNVVIEPRFARIGEFSEGLAPVAIGFGDGYGFIDETGRVVIEPKFEHASPFSEGLAAVRPNRIGGNEQPTGYINKSGDFVIPPQYERGESFHEGLACVKLKGKYGFIDRSGKAVIPIDYNSAMNFQDGLALVWLGGTSMYVDREGNVVWQSPVTAAKADLTAPPKVAGLGGRRIGGTSTTELAVRRALYYLKSVQQKDGRWTGMHSTIVATALSYSAFVRHGESRLSPEFGGCVERAQAFVLTAQPQTDEERLAVCIARADMLHVTGETYRLCEDLAQCLKAVEAATQSQWLAQLLGTTRLPDGMIRPKTLPTFLDVVQTHKEKPTPGATDPITDYREVLLTTIAKFHAGQQTWTTWNRWFAPKLVSIQDDDGGYPATEFTGRNENTAMAVIGLVVYYAFEWQFYDIGGMKPQRKEAGKDLREEDLGLEIE